MNVPEAFAFSNIAATTAAFRVRGGKYMLCATATFGGGNIQLQTLGPDAATWVNVGSSVTAAGVAVFDLAGGQYRFAITTATAVYVALSSVPD